MDSNQANHTHGRGSIAERWRPVHWWERLLYVLTALLFVCAVILDELTLYLPGWVGGEALRTLNSWLPEIGGLLWIICFPFLVATGAFALRRWRLDTWVVFRQLWSLRAILIGMSVLFALAAWNTIIRLITPTDGLLPNLPSFLVVPVFAAAGLTIVGVVLLAPEVIVRVLRAKRR